MKIDDEMCRRATGVMELIGQRWNSGILLALGRGATRFTEILTSVEGISDRMLSKRLRELQLAGLVERSIIPSTPVQVRYVLTERGSSLLAAIQPLVAWGHTWGPELTAPNLHASAEAPA